MPRHQLPAFSPVPLGAPWLAIRRAVAPGADPRARLAQRLCARYGRARAVLTDGGTQALALALRAARVLRGCASPVALPAYTCFDVAAAAVAADAAIVLYDLDPDTLGPDWESLERALKHGAGIVVVAPLCGIAVDWDRVRQTLAPYGALAVEDAAQGHGADWRGHPVGGLGTLSVLSFARGKGWTGGRGGALLSTEATIGEAIADWIQPRAGVRDELSTPLLALGQAVFGRPFLYSIPAAMPWLRLGETWYRDAPPAAPMTRTAAALLEVTWDGAMVEAEARRTNGRWMLGHLPRSRGVAAVRQPFGGSAGYLRFPVRLARGLAGFPDPRALLRLGVAPGYPGTLADLERVRERLVNPGDCWRGAETLVRELVTLPTHSRVTPADRASLAGWLAAYEA